MGLWNSFTKLLSVTNSTEKSTCNANHARNFVKLGMNITHNFVLCNFVLSVTSTWHPSVFEARATLTPPVMYFMQVTNRSKKEDSVLRYFFSNVK